MSGIQLGAQLYTVRDYTQTPQAYRETLLRIRELGYRWVQLSGAGPIDAQQLADYLNEADLTAAATHISFDHMLEDLPTVIREHQLWGCKYAGIGGMPERYRDSEEGIFAFAQDADAVAKRLADAGLTFVYHNHAWEFSRRGGRRVMEILHQHTSSAFQFELDVYWAQAGGVYPVDLVQMLSGRMDVVHFKDMSIAPDGAQRYAPIGEGNLNFDAILKACEQIGVVHALVEQDDCYGENPFDCLQRSYHYLKGLGME